MIKRSKVFRWQDLGVQKREQELIDLWNLLF
jgi:hypothetical protein